MRLTPFEHQTLIRAARASFEPGVVLRLFGSRVAVDRRGGDIDLLVETTLRDATEIARAHTRFLSQVYAALGEQKVDVLIDYPSRQERPPIFAVARQQGVVL